MRARRNALVCALTLTAALVLGVFTPSVAQAEPAPVAKDFTKPAIVVLGYGLNPNAISPFVNVG